MKTVQVDIRIELVVEEELLAEYTSLMDYARESRDELSHECRVDNYEIVDVKEIIP